MGGFYDSARQWKSLGDGIAAGAQRLLDAGGSPFTRNVFAKSEPSAPTPPAAPATTANVNVTNPAGVGAAASGFDRPAAGAPVSTDGGPSPATQRAFAPRKEPMKEGDSVHSMSRARLDDDFKKAFPGQDIKPTEEDYGKYFSQTLSDAGNELARTDDRHMPVGHEVVLPSTQSILDSRASAEGTTAAVLTRTNRAV